MSGTHREGRNTVPTRANTQICGAPVNHRFEVFYNGRLLEAVWAADASTARRGVAFAHNVGFADLEAR